MTDREPDREEIAMKIAREYAMSLNEARAFLDGDGAGERYDELREVYSGLVDRHQEAQDEYRTAKRLDHAHGDVQYKDGYQTGLIHAIVAVEELLNEWDEEDESA